MVIRLNFLHEIVAIKTKRERDPLKLAMLGLMVVILLFAGYYMFRLQTVSALKSKVNALKTEWVTKEKEQTANKAQIEELNTVSNKVAALEKWVESRFLWAPFLAAIDQVVTPEIQLNSLNGVATRANEMVTVTIDGIAAGAVARQEADKFRGDLEVTLGEDFTKVTAIFNVLEDQRDKTVTVNGKPLPTARFSIAVKLSREPKTQVTAP